MYIDYQNMPAHARVWVYQSNRPFTEEEVASIEQLGARFVNEWTAHGAHLKSSAKVFHNQFLVLSVDEVHAGASGCSIDKSVRFVQALEQQFGINFFDRSQVAFLEGGEVTLKPLTALKSLVAEGELKESTLTFDNLVPNVESLDQRWVVPAKETWLRRYFN